MISIPIKLAFIWVSLMLTYLLGDVIRIFSGDYEKMDPSFSKKMGQKGWLGISILMVIPILMIVLSMFLSDSVNRIANIVAGIFFFMFNIIGLPTYPSYYDRFLIIVGLVFNVITIAVAWNWAV